MCLNQMCHWFLSFLCKGKYNYEKNNSWNHVIQSSLYDWWALDEKKCLTSVTITGVTAPAGNSGDYQYLFVHVSDYQTSYKYVINTKPFGIVTV